MGNKISTMIGAIETGIKELVTSGDLAAVVRRKATPLTEANLPAAAIVFDGSAREVETASWDTWVVTVLVAIVMRQGEGDSDQGILDLVAKVLAKIKAVNDSNAPGGVIDRPRFTVWNHAEQGKPLAPAGAVIELRVRVDGSLAT